MLIKVIHQPTKFRPSYWLTIRYYMSAIFLCHISDRLPCVSWQVGFFFLVVFPFPHDLLIKFLSGNIAISLIHSKCDSMLKVAFKKLIFFYLKGLYTQSGLEKLNGVLQMWLQLIIKGGVVTALFKKRICISLQIKDKTTVNLWITPLLKTYILIYRTSHQM